jgi:hypothetical protein
VRSALQQIVREAPLWDKRVCNLQVTNATEQTVELRALVSAADSGQAWELRVYVRDKLLAYLQREHPGALPRALVVSSLRRWLRAEMTLLTGTGQGWMSPQRCFFEPNSSRRASVSGVIPVLLRRSKARPSASV